MVLIVFGGCRTGTLDTVPALQADGHQGSVRVHGEDPDSIIGLHRHGDKASLLLGRGGVRAGG